MARLSIVIMAHPRRKEFIPYLKSKLGNVKVVWDKKNNIWDTCSRAWKAQDLKCAYGVVIQDDALVTNNFLNKAEKFLEGDKIISFYLSRLISYRVKQAIKDKKNFAEGDIIYNEVAICIPTKWIKEMLQYAEDHNATTDQIISQWARDTRRKIYYPIPSLTSHRDELPSIYRANYNLAQPDRERKAIEFYED